MAGTLTLAQSQNVPDTLADWSRRRSGMANRLARAVLPGLIAMSAAVQTAPATAADLYQGETIVSGTVLDTRTDGLAQCLGRVLVAVSGDPALAEDRRVAAFGAHATGMLASLAYIDRISDTPRHDEQGSRDRPFTLIARFDPAAIDAALHRLGEVPWHAARPALAIDIVVHDHGQTYSMTADGDAGERQREALLAAGDRYGMPIALPATMGQPQHPTGITLRGTLTWDDSAAGWVGRWHLAWHGRQRAWGITGVSFDDAFRNAVAGAMALLSRHRPPSD